MGRTKFKFRVKAVLVAAGVWEDELMEDIPHKWERHGDLVIVAKNYFTHDMWKDMDADIWKIVCAMFQGTRMARCYGPINPHDGFRTPAVEFLFNPGDDPFVTKKENGITYRWDATKCMFSSGNITEKMRIAKFNCEGQAVVDMFAGIGYFTLPYLVHAKADRVFAIEWNQVAADALRENLKLNNVEEGKCIILVGDNTKICPLGVADHVNLGLIPSSEASWVAACQALNRTRGGILHIHGNVDVPNPHNLSDSELADRDRYGFSTNELSNQWTVYVRDGIKKIVHEKVGQAWNVTIVNLAKVKSYGPRVDHLVVDIQVAPDKSQSAQGDIAPKS